ncbi:MAG TPA: ATP-binding protein [Vicinamibacterales bacterium]|nr:ATP-binding protein [Vicinamibacterales bacterium]
MSSLRSRIIGGSVLWTIGIVVFVILAGALFAHRFPSWVSLLHRMLLTMVALILIGAGLNQLRRGLLPLKQMRARLLAVREGREPRMSGEYPAEVQPLIDDLNALLDDRDERVARAAARAGDLAHGLKTPLAVLAQEAARAEAAGQHDLAAAIGQQIARMRRQIDYHLSQARVAASGRAAGLRAPVAASAEGLVRTLQRLYADRHLAIEVNVAPDLAVRAAREDLEEMLGNLVDNACKWTTSRVVVSSSESGGRVVTTVDDDGPGLDPSMREAVLQRGVRADEAAPGSGFGLAIVRDLAVLYGGSIALDTAPMGGLRARLELPAAK